MQLDSFNNTANVIAHFETLEISSPSLAVTIRANSTWGERITMLIIFLLLIILHHFLY